MIDIVQAETPEHVEGVRGLVRAFVAWHRERHRQDLELIERYFDEAALNEELDSLPGKYAPPKGRLLLALWDRQPAGCVALRDLEGGACEMKRMFVYPEQRGRGIGKALGRRIVEDAREIGYKTMLLDTSIRQTEAQTLYQSLGFEIVQPYYELPPDLRDWLVFMKLVLR